VSFWGRLGRQSAALARHPQILITGSAAIVVVIAGGAFAVANGSATPGNPAAASVGSGHAVAQREQATQKPTPSVPALDVESVTPSSGSSGINGTDPIKVTFASDLSSSTALPQISPSVAGNWQVSGTTATFTPDVGFTPGTAVTVTVPAGVKGVSTGSAKPAPVVKESQSSHFTTGGYSTLRLQELLAQLGYLPMTFNPSGSSGEVSSSDAKAQLSAAYDAPEGSFSWNGSYPSQLTGMWATGENNTVLSGAVKTFEYNQGLTMDGVAGPEVWSALLTAAAKGQKDPSGYAYALESQAAAGGHLQVWYNGKQILDSPSNSGAPGAPSADGTFAIYERLPYQVMKGTNPNGSKYADPVHWISYFDGGDAIHAFQRGSYGSYQSVGCVELPTSTGQWLYPYLTYGTLVTVQGTPASSNA
jgi:lipoprotein-anchoring transpeptidase ErfK/SrfK